ncbi:MAG: hypothetical protein DMG88_16880 [Acidobacteria bacterium]|nr:MAG: hypothetical protein DMG88_16880 [Acidobacteriota bacterium]
MYPRTFHYHRASSLKEAAVMLSQLGEEAKLLAGGQSLIPLMKLRFANPKHLVDLNFISGTSYIKEENGGLRFGPMTRHAEIEASSQAAKIPIVRDCAAGIADAHWRIACRSRSQRRLGCGADDAANRRTLSGSKGRTNSAARELHQRRVHHRARS